MIWLNCSNLNPPFLTPDFVLKNRPVRVWSDNELIVRRGSAILAQDFVVDHQTADSDLWFAFDSLVQRVTQSVSIHKVVSHVETSSAIGADHWILVGNHWADVMAADAFESMPESLRAAHTEAITSLAEQQSLLDGLVAHFGRVGMLVKEAENSKNSPSTEREAAPSPQREISTIEVIPSVAAQAFERAQPNKLYNVHAGPVISWLHQLSRGATEVQAVSWHELLVSYQLCTRQVGMRKGKSGHWESATLLGKPYCFLTTSREFGAYLAAVFRCAYPGWRATSQRPHCAEFRQWTRTVWLQWSCENRDRTWKWLASSLAGADTRCVGSSLGVLPIADDECEVLVGGHQTGLHRFFVAS